MHRYLLIIFIVFLSQLSTLACNAQRIYSTQTLTAPVYAKSTFRFGKHIDGSLEVESNKLVIRGGMHSIDGLNKYLKQAKHLKYMLDRSGNIRREFIDILDNGVIHIFLPEESYTSKNFERISRISKKPKSSGNYIETKSIYNRTYYSHLFFPANMKNSHIEQMSIRLLQDSSTTFQRTNSSGNTTARSVYRTPGGDEIAVFIVINSQDQLVTAFPDIRHLFK